MDRVEKFLTTEVRGEFDLDPALIYLNSANLSICPRAVRHAVQRYQNEYELNPTRGLNEAWGQLWEVQRRLATFLNADPFDLFLRPNVTAVLNTFLLGVPLETGSEILVGEFEYGAIVNICQWRAKRDGLPWRMLRLPASPLTMAQLTRDHVCDLVTSQLGPQTKLLLLSHVIGGTGLRMPLREIARETRRRGIYLVVDGAYAPGAIPVDFSELDDVDFYGCSLYKWMMGPKGTAFGWVNKKFQDLLRPSQAGWTTFDSFGPFTAFANGHRFQSTFLMAGCHDFSPFRAVADTLDFWEAKGPDRIRAHRDFLQSKVEDHVAELLGWRSLAVQSPELRGPLSAFLLPSGWQPEGHRALTRIVTELKVQANTARIRGSWYLIFSPHIYNNEAEIFVAVSRLKEICEAI